MEDYSVENVKFGGGDKLVISLKGGQDINFHNIWLRDSCKCMKCYNDVSKQRLFNSCDIELDIKPLKVANHGSSIEVTWDQDGHMSKYGVDWLVMHSYDPQMVPKDMKIPHEREILQRKLWKVDDLQELPTVDYKAVMASSVESDNNKEIAAWCLKIWKHGFCLIDNVPVTPEDTQKLCEQLCYIRPTHYGGFWDFTGDMAINDTAYSSVEIASHTDGTYWSDTPGLQLFHLLYHDGTGGTSSLVDAFYCAKLMRTKYPEEFQLLTKIPIPAHSAGEYDVCIQPDIPQPIFKLDESGELIQVRWNQSDRSTMDSWTNVDDVPRFYSAIKHWYEIISDPKHEFFYQLKPGQCLIFDNWRCFHSRTEYTGKRRLCGAYINRDDFISKLKLLNVGRNAILNSL